MIEKIFVDIYNICSSISSRLWNIEIDISRITFSGIWIQKSKLSIHPKLANNWTDQFELQMISDYWFKLALQ